MSGVTSSSFSKIYGITLSILSETENRLSMLSAAAKAFLYAASVSFSRFSMSFCFIYAGDESNYIASAQPFSIHADFTAFCILLSNTNTHLHQLFSIFFLKLYPLHIIINIKKEKQPPTKWLASNDVTKKVTRRPRQEWLFYFRLLFLSM